MNEFQIRNGFSESDAPKMLTMGAGMRDYVNSEYHGRVHAVIVRPVKKSKIRLRFFRAKKESAKGPVVLEAAQTGKR